MLDFSGRRLSPGRMRMVNEPRKNDGIDIPSGFNGGLMAGKPSENAGLMGFMVDIWIYPLVSSNMPGNSPVNEWSLKSLGTSLRSGAVPGRNGDLTGKPTFFVTLPVDQLKNEHRPFTGKNWNFR